MDGTKKDQGDRGLRCSECGQQRLRVVYTRPRWGGKVVRLRETLGVRTSRILEGVSRR